MSTTYDLAYILAAIISSPIWVFKLFKTGKWRTDWRGKFGQIKNKEPANSKTKRILFHAVSVGEVAAIARLIELLDKEHQSLELIIATTTNTGHQRAVKMYGKNHKIVRYPLDFSFAVKKFLNALKPDALVLVELELWPNMISACKKRNIPVCVINGRLSTRSFKRYKTLPPPLRGIVKKMFAALSAAGVQNQTYAKRFESLGTPQKRIHILDTMKWDNAKITELAAGRNELAEQMGINLDKPVVVGGSTGPGEEKMLIEACPKEAQLVLVPRKPERFEAVAKLDSRMVRRTQTIDSRLRANDGEGNERGDSSKNCIFLIDTMGELAKAYALADVVVIGRSFNGQGGSDPIEPIALGKPTIIGPEYENFQSVVDAFKAEGGIIITQDVSKTICALLADKKQAMQTATAGRAVIKAYQGSTQRHADMIMGILKTGQHLSS